MRPSQQGGYKNRATPTHRGLPPSPIGPLKRMFLIGNITLKFRQSSPDFQGHCCLQFYLSHRPQGHGHPFEGVSRGRPINPPRHAVGADPCVRPPCRASVASLLLWHSRPRLCKLLLLFCGTGGERLSACSRRGDPVGRPLQPRFCESGLGSVNRAGFSSLATFAEGRLQKPAANQGIHAMQNLTSA